MLRIKCTLLAIMNIVCIPAYTYLAYFMFWYVVYAKFEIQKASNAYTCTHHARIYNLCLIIVILLHVRAHKMVNNMDVKMGGYMTYYT